MQFITKHVFRSKNRKEIKFNSVCYYLAWCHYLASKLKSMWSCESPQKRRIVIQNGRQNEVAVVTYVTVRLSRVTKKVKYTVAVKKRGVAKINSGQSAKNVVQIH